VRFSKTVYLMDRILILFILLALLLLASLSYIFLVSSLSRTYLFLLGIALVLGFLVYLSYWWVYIPYKETNKVFQLFTEGYILKGVFDVRVHFNRETAQLMQKLKEMIDTKDMIEGARKHAEYLALQNQINPHFLYNTLEGIRSEALIEGVESIAAMTEALETFFRYTISNVDKLTTLAEEIANVENYCTIQRFRFGEKIAFRVENLVGEELDVYKAKIPKLTLQPIVENAVFHGLEPKLGGGLVSIILQATPERLLITVSDNGVGMEDDHVHELNDKLRGASLDYVRENKQKGGIALLNVNNRIKLLFGDEYGVYLYSKLGVGTDVELTLPLIF
jgi:two-component system sensor histidine kinase YesM